MGEHPGLEFARQSRTVFSNFNLDALSSVVYKLYDNNPVNRSLHRI